MKILFVVWKMNDGAIRSDTIKIEGKVNQYTVERAVHNKLGYYEVFNDIKDAIIREKQIKSGSRKKKIQLIESINPTWLDLYEKIKP